MSGTTNNSLLNTCNLLETRVNNLNNTTSLLSMTNTSLKNTSNLLGSTIHDLSDVSNLLVMTNSSLCTTNTAAVSALVELQLIAALLGINFGMDSAGVANAPSKINSQNGKFTQSVSSTHC